MTVKYIQAPAPEEQKLQKEVDQAYWNAKDGVWRCYIETVKIYEQQLNIMGLQELPKQLQRDKLATFKKNFRAHLRNL